MVASRTIEIKGPSFEFGDRSAMIRNSTGKNPFHFFFLRIFFVLFATGRSLVTVTEVEIGDSRKRTNHQQICKIRPLTGHHSQNTLLLRRRNQVLGVSETDPNQAFWGANEQQLGISQQFIPLSAMFVINFAIKPAPGIHHPAHSFSQRNNRAEDADGPYSCVTSFCPWDTNSVRSKKPPEQFGLG